MTPEKRRLYGISTAFMVVLMAIVIVAAVAIGRNHTPADSNCQATAHYSPFPPSVRFSDEIARRAMTLMLDTACGFRHDGMILGASPEEVAQILAAGPDSMRYITQHAFPVNASEPDVDINAFLRFDRAISVPMFETADTIVRGRKESIEKCVGHSFDHDARLQGYGVLIDIRNPRRDGSVIVDECNAVFALLGLKSIKQTDFGGMYADGDSTVYMVYGARPDKIIVACFNRRIADMPDLKQMLDDQLSK